MEKIAIILTFSFAFATVINVPNDQPTIQAGIDASVDGDTVLVQPDTYVENINFNGHNIIVMSVLGPDSTIIWGNSTDYVVKFQNGETPDATLSGFTITNGKGGIRFTNQSNAYLDNLIVTLNTTDSGIVVKSQSSIILKNSLITENHTAIEPGVYYNYGGGLRIYNSNAEIENVTISYNTSHIGAGINIEGSDINLVTLSNVIITSNYAENKGGGISKDWTTNLVMEQVTITDNFAKSFGGGIYFDYSVSEDHYYPSASIYNNHAGLGNDLYNASDQSIFITLDTFTVAQPTNYHMTPEINFNIDIQTGYFEQQNSNLYVSPNGDDQYTGIYPESPLKTIDRALSTIFPDAETPLTIFLENGIYSETNNGEWFPLSSVSNITIEGESAEGTILDGESINRLWMIGNSENFRITQITNTNGDPNSSGAIVWSSNSTINVDHVAFINTQSTNYGIWKQRDYGSDSSEVNFNHITLANNSTTGIWISGHTNITIDNSIFWNNNPIHISAFIFGEGNGLEIDNSILEGGFNNVSIGPEDILNWGPNIISEPPLFCNPGNGVYTLAENSPALYLSADSSYVGAFDVGCDFQEPWTGPVYHVAIDGSDIQGNGSLESPYQTIQRSINATDHGDTVIVHPGRYIENIDYTGKNIVVGSEYLYQHDDMIIQQTIIDGNQDGSVVTFESGEDSTAVLSGFTITNGSGHNVDGFCGGGIYIESSTPTLNFLHITENSVTDFGFVWPLGGGICVWYNSSLIINNVIVSNNYAYEGAGIFVMSNSSSKLSNLTIVNNYAEWQGGCISGYGTEEEFIFQNSICWDNTAGISDDEIRGEFPVLYSDIQEGYDGIGNIDSNPLFIDSENGDYHLLPNSPCIDAGDPDSPPDPDGTITDMGAYYFDQSEECPVPGDVNDDNEIDILDITLTIGCILDEPGNCPCADLNFDSTVDVLDIVLMVEIILDE